MRSVPSFFSLLLLLLMLMMMTCDALMAREQVLKEIQAEMSLDAVEELMADTHEAIAHQQVRHLCTTHHHPPPLFTHTLAQEIENILAGKLTDEDEEAILAELDELVQQVRWCGGAVRVVRCGRLTKTYLVERAEQEGVPQMPEVPTGKPTATDPQKGTSSPSVDQPRRSFTLLALQRRRPRPRPSVKRRRLQPSDRCGCIPPSTSGARTQTPVDTLLSCSCPLFWFISNNSFFCCLRRGRL